MRYEGEGGERQQEPTITIGGSGWQLYQPLMNMKAMTEASALRIILGAVECTEQGYEVLLHSTLRNSPMDYG